MKDLAKQFKIKMKCECKDYRWFHEKYVKIPTYPQFLIQLRDDEKMSRHVEDVIREFLEGE